MSNSEGGIDDLVAISMPEENDSPMDHTALRGRDRLQLRRDGSPGLFPRCDSSRTYRPLKVRLCPHQISEVSIENSVSSATALRGVLGSPANQGMARCTSGVEATT